MKKISVTQLENRVLIAALVFLFFASLVTAALQIDPAWQSPLVFLALIAIVRFVVPVDEIHENVRYLREAAGLSVQSFPSVEAFYSGLVHAVREAEYTLDLTHIRDNPPDDFRGSHPGEYFALVCRWLKEDEARSVRRIIAVRNRPMLDWAQQLAREVAHLKGYMIRVVDWSVEAPAINMAIVDNKVVFLAVSGETLDRTRGLAVEDSSVASYFSEYYNRLWHDSVPLTDFLETPAAHPSPPTTGRADPLPQGTTATSMTVRPRRQGPRNIGPTRPDDPDRTVADP